MKTIAKLAVAMAIFLVAVAGIGAATEYETIYTGNSLPAFISLINNGGAGTYVYTNPLSYWSSAQIRFLAVLSGFGVRFNNIIS